MLKIVIGAAWVDGTLQPQEATYLEAIMDRHGFSHDRELLALLQRPVAMTLTERWLVEFLADATPTQRQILLGAIGNLLYADRRITDAEHNLLDDLHTMMATIPALAEPPEVAQAVGHWVKKALNALTGNQ